jgi:hypothetical protein
MPSSRKTRDSVREVLNDKNNPGKEMMKVGAALIMMPEPVTSIAGVPILLFGKVINSNRGTNVKGVYEELSEALRIISSATNF